jgi:hypothetical protein
MCSRRYRLTDGHEQSLREKGFGSTFFTPSLRAAAGDPPRPLWKRADNSRIGAAYACSVPTTASAACGSGTLAMTSTGVICPGAASTTS